MRQDVFNPAKRLLRFLFGAVGHDFASIHDRAREHGPETGILYRADGLERALGAWVEKIMLAQSRDSAANSLDASEQAADVEMLRSKHTGAAVDPFEPRHQLEIFPHRAQ